MQGRGPATRTRTHPHRGPQGPGREGGTALGAAERCRRAVTDQGPSIRPTGACTRGPTVWAAHLCESRWCLLTATCRDRHQEVLIYEDTAR